MSDQRRDDLLDEAVLRRALRLDDDERAPRFDARAMAEAARTRMSPAMMLAGVLVALAIGLSASVLWAGAIANAAAVSGEALDLLFDGVAAAAEVLYPIVQTVSDPAMPLALLAAIVVTIYHETRMRRGSTHAQAA